MEHQLQAFRLSENALRMTSMVTGFMPRASSSSGRAQRTSLTSRGRGEDAGARVAEIVDENVVILRAAFTVRKDRVQDIQHWADFHIEAGFFADFAGDAIAQLFSEVECASGDGPLALQAEDWRGGR